MINLYFIDYFSRKNSGLATYVHQLVNHISKDKRIALHVIFVKAAGRQSIQKEKFNNQIQYYVPFDIALRPNNKNDAELVAYLKQESTNKEQIIFHFNWINHAPFAQTLKNKINCKTILTKHCIPWRDLITDNYPIFLRLNHQFFSKENTDYLAYPLMREYIAYHSVDHIICVTHFAQHALLRMLQFPKEKTTVIPNGLNLTKSSRQSKRELKVRYGFDPDEQLILFAGHVHQRKGVYDLVSTFDSILLKNYRVRLVIAGEGDYRNVFKSAHKNWAKITMTGELDKKTLYDFYRMADVGVVPSYVEQCSYTTIEMMYHGLPIVVSDVDGLTEIVPDDCGLKSPLILGKKAAYIDRVELAKSILHFLESHDASKQYAFRAREYALRNFNADRMVVETVHVYEKLIADAGVRQSVIKCLQNNPLVSVILPCHNGGDYLKACIDSILQQTYSTFELIIINDGSTDRTAKVLEKCKDDRIIVLRNEINLGIVDSLNRGVKLAKGKYIARIDADDMMHEDRLYKQVRYLEESENADIVLVGSHHQVIDQTGRIVGLKQYPITNDEIANVLLFQNPFSHPSVMIRANVLKQMKYSKKFPHAEDFHLWFRLIRKYKTSNLPEYLTYYRIHDKNVSSQEGVSQKESVVELLSSELEHLGIEHSVGELAIHIAICLGFGNKYFNTPEKVNLLENWINKVLGALQQRNGYSNTFVNKMKQYVRQNICGVYVS